MTFPELVHDLADRLRDCSYDELRVVDRVLQGLERGREVYGPLDVKRDPRNFVAEACQEMRDTLIYLAAHEIAVDDSHDDPQGSPRLASSHRAPAAGIEAGTISVPGVAPQAAADDGVDRPKSAAAGTCTHFDFYGATITGLGGICMMCGAELDHGAFRAIVMAWDAWRNGSSKPSGRSDSSAASIEPSPPVEAREPATIYHQRQSCLVNTHAAASLVHSKGECEFAQRIAPTKPTGAALSVTRTGFADESATTQETEKCPSIGRVDNPVERGLRELRGAAGAFVDRPSFAWSGGALRCNRCSDVPHWNGVTWACPCCDVPDPDATWPREKEEA